MISLRVVGILYLLSGLWCASQAELSANFLGFALTSLLAHSEFFSVYGGLQVGLGVAMLGASFRRTYIEAALYFAYVFSMTLFLFRVASAWIWGWNTSLLSMLILEAILATILCISWAKKKGLQEKGVGLNMKKGSG